MNVISCRLDDRASNLLRVQAADRKIPLATYLTEILSVIAEREEQKKTATEERLEVIEKSSRTLEYNTELCSFLIAQLMKQHFGQDITAGLVKRAETLVRTKYPDIFPARESDKK